MGRAPGGVPLGVGRDGEAWTKRWRCVHTQTHVRARPALVWPLITWHHEKIFGGHALTVGMKACIVGARSTPHPLFGGHIVVAGPMTSKKSHGTCAICL